MPDETDEALGQILGHKSESVTRWWIASALDRDCYDLFVVRYTVINGVFSQGTYLRIDRIEEEQGENFYPGGIVCRWINYNPGEIIEPAYSFPGFVLNIFAATEWLDRENIEHMLRHLAVEIFANEIQRRMGLELEND